MSRFACRVSGLVVAGLGLAGGGFAATVTTCADDEADGCGVGECTLREAIAGAAVGETIDFASPLSECVDGEIDLVGSGLTIAQDLTILGPGADQLAVDGQGRRVFSVTGGIVILEDFTVKGGATSHGGAHGAGIQNGGDLTLSRIVVTGNHAFGTSDSVQNGASGGGIHNQLGAVLHLEESVVSGNTAGRAGFSFNPPPFAAGNGGGIHNEGMLVLLASTVTGNDAGFGGAPSGSGGHGGGIYNSGGTIHIERSTIAANRTGNGNNDFGGSGRDGFGGGVYTTGSGVLTIVNSTFSGNATGTSGTGLAGDGGGLYLTGSSSVSIGGATISSNHADRNGGGILRASSAAVTISDSIIAGNTGSSTTRDCSGISSGSAGHNLVGVGNGCSGFLSPGEGGTDQEGTSASPLDPLLDPLADNGGPTETHLPQLPSSPKRSRSSTTSG